MMVHIVIDEEGETVFNLLAFCVTYFFKNESLKKSLQHSKQDLDLERCILIISTYSCVYCRL